MISGSLMESPSFSVFGRHPPAILWEEMVAVKLSIALLADSCYHSPQRRTPDGAVGVWWLESYAVNRMSRQVGIFRIAEM